MGSNVSTALSNYATNIKQVQETSCNASAGCRNVVEGIDVTFDSCPGAQTNIEQTCTANATCSIDNVAEAAAKTLQEQKLDQATASTLFPQLNLSTSVTQNTNNISAYLQQRCGSNAQAENYLKNSKLTFNCNGGRGNILNIKQLGDVKSTCASAAVQKAITDTSSIQETKQKQSNILMLIVAGVVGIAVIGGVVAIVKTSSSASKRKNMEQAARIRQQLMMRRGAVDATMTPGLMSPNSALSLDNSMAMS